MKTKMVWTKKQQEILDARDEIWSKGNKSSKIQLNDLTTIYLFKNHFSRPGACFYYGRSMKGESVIYLSDESRAKVIKQVVENRNKAFAEKQARKGAGSVRTLQVGDVVRNSWGYEQTNVDYYKVVSLIGKQTVELVEIGQTREYTGQDYGTCKPDPSVVLGESFKAREINGYVKTKYGRARKVERKADGEFPSSGWSSYH